MKKINLFIACVALASVGVSCKSGDTPNDPSKSSAESENVFIQLAVDNSNVSVPDTNFRYIAYVYDASSNAPVDTIRSNKSLIGANLKKGNYRVEAWADYVPFGKSEDFYFQTTDASKLSLLKNVAYVGDDSQKMAFYGSFEISVGQNGAKGSATLNPQMGQYKLYAKDTPDYNVGRVKVSYPNGVPMSVCPNKQEDGEILNDVSYEAKTSNTLVTFDNIFVAGNETEVTVCIQVYDTGGTLKSKKIFKVPVVKGAVKSYSAEIYKSSGITIDDGFDDTFFIEL